MLRPFLLTRASIGLAATAVEQAITLPGRTVQAIGALPTVPVRLAGQLVQSYLHVGQTVTGFAVKGDQVLGAVFTTSTDQPDWATFDEDETDPGESLDVSYRVYGSTGPSVSNNAASNDAGSNRAGSTAAGSDVATGRVAPRTP